MTSKLLVLFFTPLLSGLLIYFLPVNGNRNFRLVLVFAGAYLFAITVTHILPELYVEHEELKWVGVFVLLGFFLQQVLEYFTSGVEHGHVPSQDHDHHHHGHEHSHKPISAVVLLAALCVHAFLEGSILAQPLQYGMNYDINAILLGIVLHRAPAAFALMAVLSFQLGSKRKSLPHLIIFSLAAPVGLLVSTYLFSSEVLSQTGMIYLYALVSGNFLHISTTIVFESSPDHHFNARKLLVAVIGAVVAVAIENAM
jgi:zinc transporter ZupT